MDDSDDSNIDRVGHRRWCLNPTMSKTAFGVHKAYSAMYSFDMQRQTATPDRVYYPAPGWFPASYLKKGAAWSISLDPEHYAEPSSFTVSVWRADDQFKKAAPAEVDYKTVSHFGSGTPLCLIFRFKGSHASGERYWVEIKGVKQKNGDDAVIEYFVELF
jgi:hypothetical protein